LEELLMHPMPTTDPVAVLQELVAIPSVNPLHTDDAAIADEFRMADDLAARLAALGFEVEHDRLDERRGNVIGTYGDASAARSLLFEAHLDTVGVADMTIPPFTPTIRDGRLYGRGACDMKGAMAAALTALDVGLLERLRQAGYRVLFIGAYGEETGNLGAERLVERGLGADAAIILEPTELEIVYGHKGALWMDAHLVGEAGHGSDPERACSAITVAAAFVMWLQEQIGRDVAESAHAELGAPTLNVGRIDGGLAINIVAQHCRLQLDRRWVSGESAETIVASYQAWLDEACAAGRLVSGTIDVRKQGDPFVTARDSELVRGLQAALAAEGLPPACATAAWFSDAGAFSRTCDQIVVFGPGSIEQAHTADEYIELAELEKGRRVLRAYLEGLLVA
jgi:acetylornithine deacetylase/succinyl-diaminopimelate desuccinylase-like protein